MAAISSAHGLSSLLPIFDSFVRPYVSTQDVLRNHQTTIIKQVATSSDDDSDDDDDTTSTKTSEKKKKQPKNYINEILRSGAIDVENVSTIGNYLMKKRNWPMRGWHKRYFLLDNGYLMYGKSEQEIKRGRYNGRCDIGLCIVTFIREVQRISVDETNFVYHIKIKDKKQFDQWLDQIAQHRSYRQKQLEKVPDIQDIEQQNRTDSESTIVSTSDRLFYNDFADIQIQLSSLSDILEQIKLNTKDTEQDYVHHGIHKSAKQQRPSIAELKHVSFRQHRKDLKVGTNNLSGNDHQQSPSIGSVHSNSSTTSSPDFQRIEYFHLSKKVFDNLNSLYKRLSLLAIESNTRNLSGLHSTSSTLSRQGSIFYDAPEAFGNLLLLDKDECDKTTVSESTSDDESPAGSLDTAHRRPTQSTLHPVKPPQIKWRRSSLPATAPDSSNIKLWDIMRKAIGKDLSRIAMPVILNEPLGLLQKLCEEMEYTDLLDKASLTDDKYQRMVYVAAFIISTYSSNYYRTGRKNFNPLLGETYECIREDKGWKFIAEQDLLVENSNGTKARISFMQSNYRTRLNNVAGDIENEQGDIVHKLFGHWHNDVFCGNDQTAKCIWKQSAVLENSKQYYGFTRFAIELNELDDDLKQQLPPTDSRLRPDQRLLEAGDIESAEKEKARIEDGQRQRTREQEQCHEKYEPLWFDVNYEQQSYKPKYDMYWKKREEKFLGINFMNLW
ncbi:unnamed protein product [Didymodactylos carnosus]|uniref:PH domain-containing protein n=1 Tax=Didymodactylos carnosus TaxID=1234261 RepID=A0A814C4W8_9BILA|nr:unnamed protein product [Didymodactylos carnosus]CAF0936833.1 unnamed protein product [Didymodactylos carnosus]CAF3690366.1 unnamed protein product [Didymodactylos carnosus]CAF3713906.1 unnamed protein product [Didymodactylos carnosus]